MSEATLVPIEELATQLHLKPTTLRSWVRNGLIPKSCYIRVGNTYRFDVAKVVFALRADQQLEEGEAPAEYATPVAVADEMDSEEAVEENVQVEAEPLDGFDIDIDPNVV